MPDTVALLQKQLCAAALPVDPTLTGCAHGSQEMHPSVPHLTRMADHCFEVCTDETENHVSCTLTLDNFQPLLHLKAAVQQWIEQASNALGHLNY